METLQWTCLLGLLSVRAAPSWSETPMVSQSPKAISLLKVHSTAEIRCKSTLHDPVGLYLKRRFSDDKQVLYLSVPKLLLTFGRGYEHRVSMTGKCCNFTFQMSQLMMDDTDGYYCSWTQFDVKTKEITVYKSKETIIIVRDPNENCSRNSTMEGIFFILSLPVLVIVVSVIIGAAVSYCTRTKVYRPAKVHQHRQLLCPHHSDQQSHSRKLRTENQNCT
ncbi:uncharacterized protein LOC108939975 [Scleropages formosus]|uniref:uncharacterized protein LOC108939975 n=1 Tax=Scleropages formosus TaxID=113540 RepID=UPI0008780E7C|nr:uncharacterized protein LOC108939975 [Scleropages formosus]